MISQRAATLILTHATPDLDAIGFIYSARKVFGAETSVTCRPPTRAELEDPAVIVADIGLPGCEEIGHSPALNNFDHHYSHADRSATFLFNQKYGALREDIVAYIDAVDIAGARRMPRPRSRWLRSGCGCATPGAIWRSWRAGSGSSVGLRRQARRSATSPAPCHATLRTICKAARQSCAGSKQNCTAGWATSRRWCACGQCPRACRRALRWQGGLERH